MAENIYNWQFNCLPGNAKQGAVLMTRDDIARPPFNQDDFIWKAMEDVFGVSNVKLEYNEAENKYHIYKTKGHLDNEGNWAYDWEEFGTWDALTEEVVEALRSLVYIKYDFEQEELENEIIYKVYGTKKDGTRILLNYITFVKKEYVDDVIASIQKIIAGRGITATDVGNERTLDLNITEDFSIDAENKLKSELIKDNLDSSTDKTWSIDKIKELPRLNYKGSVGEKSDLPTGSVGDVYYVNSEADLYLKDEYQWVPFTDIYTEYDNTAIKLNKSLNGLYATLNYNTIDFYIDNFHNLKSQIIDDTMGSGDENANRKTYSIEKITQLLSQSMRYKGQVNTYADLPTTGNVIGDMWNVVEYGDNYAWNGTGWDKLAGDYIAGAGIVINGKTISATGISFIVGEGLEATGAGSTTTLKTRNSHGLMYSTDGSNMVKPGNCITVNSNGVNVNTGFTTKTERNNIEVNYGKGLQEDTNDSNKLAVKIDNKTLHFNSSDEVAVITTEGLLSTPAGVAINANFDYDPTPLGDKTSNIKLHSDGRIAVALGEALSGDVLFERASFTLNTWYNLSSGKSLQDYLWIQIGRLNGAQLFSMPAGTNLFQFGVVMGGGSPLGVTCMSFEVDRTNNRIRLKQWGQYDTGSTVHYMNQSSALDEINITGIK